MSAHFLIIHGLAPKPAPDVLKERYLRCLNQGLTTEVPETNLQLIHWANDIGHDDLSAADDEYQEGFPHFKPLSFWQRLANQLRGLFRSKLKNNIEAHLENLLSNDSQAGTGTERLLQEISERPAKLLYRYLVKDLHTYLHGGKRAPIRDKLTRAVNAIDSQDPVILIAHSMGSIIALDALINADIRNITHFVTIGSPIGMRIIQQQVGANDAGKAVLASRVTEWSNLYDPLDKIAIDIDLADDFGGGVQDIGITNTFVTKSGDRNPHKSYGYLNSDAMNTIVAKHI